MSHIRAKFNATFQWHGNGVDVEAMPDGARFRSCAHVRATACHVINCNCLSCRRLTKAIQYISATYRLSRLAVQSLEFIVSSLLFSIIR